VAFAKLLCFLVIFSHRQCGSTGTVFTLTFIVMERGEVWPVTYAEPVSSDVSVSQQQDATLMQIHLWALKTNV